MEAIPVQISYTHQLTLCLVTCAGLSWLPVNFECTLNIAFLVSVNPCLKHNMRMFLLKLLCMINYLSQGGYVFISIQFVCLKLAVLCKNYWTDFHKIWWKDGTWATEETIRFCCYGCDGAEWYPRHWVCFTHIRDQQPWWSMDSAECHSGSSSSSSQYFYCAHYCKAMGALHSTLVKIQLLNIECRSKITSFEKFPKVCDIRFC